MGFGCVLDRTGSAKPRRGSLPSYSMSILLYGTRISRVTPVANSWKVGSLCTLPVCFFPTLHYILWTSLLGWHYVEGPIHPDFSLIVLLWQTRAQSSVKPETSDHCHQPTVTESKAGWSSSMNSAKILPQWGAKVAWDQLATLWPISRHSIYGQNRAPMHH